MVFVKKAIVTIMVLHANSAMAQTTDASSILNAALAKLGPMTVTSPYPVEVEYQECRWHMSHSRDGGSPDGYETCENKKRTETRFRTDSTMLVASNISIVFSYPPDFGKETFSDFPSDVIEASNEYINCTDGNGNYNVSLSLSAVRSQSVTLSNAVTNTIGGSVKFGIKPFNVGADVTLTFTQATTSGESQTESGQSSYTVANTGSVSVGAMKGVVATLRSYKLQALIPFSVRGVIDGDVNTNDQGIKRASDRVTEADRTVTVSGVVTATDYSRGQLVIFQLKDACMNRTGTSQGLFSPTSNQKLYIAPTEIYKLKIDSPSR